jgi:flavin-dependent dehydrogenase
MNDVLIVGAGPAGSIAALVLARAGVRVRLVDRAAFPRDKLCGDTINPGTLTALRRLGVSGEIERVGLRIDGMVLTGQGGVSVVGKYSGGAHGRAIVRRELDAILLRAAIDAGVAFEPNVAVQRAVLAEQEGRAMVVGVAAGVNGRDRKLDAPVIIAADGRHSTLAFGLGLARHPEGPRRWAIGAYFADFGDIGVRPLHGACRGLTPGMLGEMHVRRGRYIGVAAIPGGLTNVCLVKPSGPADADLRDPSALLTRELARDPMLRDRAAAARLVAPPVVLGPLAVDATRLAPDGLLLAGDASGFVDPITGDGLRFAVRGGELAAAAALQALEHGWSGVHARLADERRREFASKWRFNRALRRLVGSYRTLAAATVAGRYVPRAFQAVIARAGDCAEWTPDAVR